RINSIRKRCGSHLFSFSSVTEPRLVSRRCTRGSPTPTPKRRCRRQLCSVRDLSIARFTPSCDSTCSQKNVSATNSLENCSRDLASRQFSSPFHLCSRKEISGGCWPIRALITQASWSQESVLAEKSAHSAQRCTCCFT